MEYIGQAKGANDLAIALRAVNLPKHDRGYSIRISSDLFGTWLIDIEWGRGGTLGQSSRLSAQSLAEARVLMLNRLKRRLGAPRRIQADYQVTQITDPGRLLGPLPPAPNLAQVIECLKS